MSWWERHWSYAIEIAYRQAELGHKIFFIQCKKALATCAANPEHLSWKCNQCIHQSNFSLRKHFPSGTQVLQLDHYSIDNDQQLSITPQVQNMQDLQDFKYKNFPFGRHVLSHLISLRRDRFIPEHVIKTLGVKFLLNSIATYEAIMDLFPDGSEFVYLWGGRRPSEAPMKFAAKTWNSKLFFFEEGSQLDKIYISDNDPINFEDSYKDIKAWEAFRKSNSQVDVMLQSGLQYFSDRREGKSKEPNFRWFLSDSLPSEIQKERGRQTLSIFTSSDWEFALYDSLKHPRGLGEFDNQYDTLTRIINDLDILSRFKVIVRWHPNHKIAGKYESKKIEELISANPQVVHYKFDNPVDSYDLIQKSDLVVVFGSTIGIEAAAAGIPTILLGGATYSGISAVYEPENYDSFRILLNGKLEALPNYWSLVWGDWLHNRGTKMKYVSMRDSSFSIDNQKILHQNYSLRLRFQLSKLLAFFSRKGNQTLSQKITFRLHKREF